VSKYQWWGYGCGCGLWVFYYIPRKAWRILKEENFLEKLFGFPIGVYGGKRKFSKEVSS